MAVLIDMELPEKCDDCRFHQYHSGNNYVCVASPLFYPWNLANYKEGRKDFCPLKEADEIGNELINVARLEDIENILKKYCGEKKTDGEVDREKGE